MRDKLDFRKLTNEMETELKSVRDSPRALIVMFDAYMMSAVSEIIAIRFDSDYFSKKNDNLQLEVARSFKIISPALFQNIAYLSSIRNMIAHTPDIQNKKFVKEINEKIQAIPTLEGGMFADDFGEDFEEAGFIVYRALENAYGNEWRIYESENKRYKDNEKKREKRIKFKEALWKVKQYLA